MSWRWVSGPACTFGLLRLTKSRNYMIWGRMTRWQAYNGPIPAATLQLVLTQAIYRYGTLLSARWLSSLEAMMAELAALHGTAGFWVPAPEIRRFFIGIWGRRITLRRSWSGISKRCAVSSGVSMNSSLHREAMTTNSLYGASRTARHRKPSSLAIWLLWKP